MIIRKVEDYYDIHESLIVLNEGRMWDWVSGKMKKIFGAYGNKLDALIAPDIVDKAINPKTGELENKIIDISQIQDTDVPIGDIFATIKKKVPKGKFFLNGLNFIEEYAKKADADFAAGVAETVMGKERDEDDPEKDISGKTSEALKERAKEYDLAFKQKFSHMESMIKKEIKEFDAKAKQKKVDKKFTKGIMIRYNNAKAVLLMIKYEIMKKRWKLEDVGELSNEMTESYKKAVTLTKEIAADIGEKKEEIGEESAQRFKELITDNYNIGDDVTIKGNDGKAKKANIQDFGEDTITLLVGGRTNPQQVKYEDFNKWVIRETDKGGV